MFGTSVSISMVSRVGPYLVNSVESTERSFSLGLLTLASPPHPRCAVCPEACGPPHRRVCSPEHRQQQQQQFSLLTKSYLITGHPQCRALHQLVPLRGRTQLSLPTLLSRVKEVNAQNLPHLTDPMSNTRCCEFGHVHLSRLHSGPAVLGGQGEAGEAGQSSVVQSGIVLEKWVGSVGSQLPGDSQATSHPGHSVLTICKPTQGWRPSTSFLL